MINASGYKVWPAEVEAMMQGHPDIKEVCIIAAPDREGGDRAETRPCARRRGHRGLVQAAHGRLQGAPAV